MGFVRLCQAVDEIHRFSWSIKSQNIWAFVWIIRLKLIWCFYYMCDFSNTIWLLKMILISVIFVYDMITNKFWLWCSTFLRANVHVPNISVVFSDGFCISPYNTNKPRINWTVCAETFSTVYLFKHVSTYICMWKYSFWRVPIVRWRIRTHQNVDNANRSDSVYQKSSNISVHRVRTLCVADCPNLNAYKSANSNASDCRNVTGKIYDLYDCNVGKFRKISLTKILFENCITCP